MYRIVWDSCILWIHRDWCILCSRLMYSIHTPHSFLKCHVFGGHGQILFPRNYAASWVWRMLVECMCVTCVNEVSHLWMRWMCVPKVMDGLTCKESDGLMQRKWWFDAKKVMVWCKESDGLMRRIAAWLRRDSRHVTHTWLIAMCDMTHGDVWHDSLIQVSHTHGPTVFPQIVQQLSYTKYIYLIHTCDSFRKFRALWGIDGLIQMCTMTYS